MKHGIKSTYEVVKSGRTWCHVVESGGFHVLFLSSLNTENSERIFLTNVGYKEGVTDVHE